MATKQLIQYSGTDKVYASELILIKKFAEKAMGRITKISDYNKLKVDLKSHGNTQNTSRRKFSMNILLSKGNKIVHVNKEIVQGSSDELRNDKVKGKWNLVETIQEAFEVLETKILNEKGRRSY